MAIALTLSFLAATCVDPGSPRPEGPGTVQVALISPNGAEGSAVFELQTEASLGMVSALAGDVYYEHNQGRQTSRVIVVLDTPGQVGFRVAASETGKLPSVTLLQVADGDDQLRGSLSGYEIEITRLPAGGS